MTTAYIIHNSEGVPVRRIMITKEEDGILWSTIYDANDNWYSNDDSGKNPIRKYSEKREQEHHLYVRKYLADLHSYRFEVYWPLSTIFS